MTSNDERCKALAERQLKLYLSMRRQRKTLLDGKPYTPTLTAPKPVEKPKFRRVA